MMELTQFLLKKKRSPPLGLSVRTFFKKLNTPRASKPWRDRNALVSGRIEMDANIDVCNTGEQSCYYYGNLAVNAPMGVRGIHPEHTLHIEQQEQQQQQQEQQEQLSLINHNFTRTINERQKQTSNSTADADNCEYDHQCKEATNIPMLKQTSLTSTKLDAHALLSSNAINKINSNNVDYLSACANNGDMIATNNNTNSLATLPVGQTLQMNVSKVVDFEDAPVPVHFAHLKRTRREAAESIVLPRHLNRLFHQIMGWSAELGEMEEQHEQQHEQQQEQEQESDHDTVFNNNDNNNNSDSCKLAPLSPAKIRLKVSTMTEALKYGVLMDAYDKDKFALEHRLAIAGSKFERKFLEWEGLHVLDQSASAELDHVHHNKTAIVLDTPPSDKIPIVNRDCCPGCGVLLQDKNEEEFGFVSAEDIARYVQAREQRRQARNEYAARMNELINHWAQNGRQVGEEWLDFMTQEEFNAFYRDRHLPFVCNRCHALENVNAANRHQVWSAPDFTEQLRALREHKCVVVLVIDLTDFPGSMVYDLPGLISMNNSVIIAVNKVDCIRNRSFQYHADKNVAISSRLITEKYIANWVRDIAISFGLPRRQIKDIVPVSAKRGWNVNKLISAIEHASNLNLRRPEPPLSTYFVGVANVGKSSLINAIAHHLYTPQPPHPRSTKVYYTLTDSSGNTSIHYRWYTPPNCHDAEMRDILAHHDKRASKLLTVSSLPGTTVGVNAIRVSLNQREEVNDKQNSSSSNNNNSSNKEITRGSKHHTPVRSRPYGETYLYDTPGLIPHWHRFSPLTLYQMRRTLIRRFRNPECYILIPGHTLFMSGLAAIDVVKGPSAGLLFMVYTSHKVHNAIVDTERSETFWVEQLGKLLDPPGSLEQIIGINKCSTNTNESSKANTRYSQGREKKLEPYEELCESNAVCGLSENKSYYFECYNKHRRRPKADIYVCGIGWVSFCVSCASDVVLRVRTVPGVVHGVREPLRYKDLRAFKHWPKLRRRNTSQSIIDFQTDVDEDSVNTVVRLVEKPVESTLTLQQSCSSSLSSASQSDTKSKEVEQHNRITTEANTYNNTTTTTSSSFNSVGINNTLSANASSVSHTSKAEDTFSILQSLEKVQKTQYVRDTVASSAPLHHLVEELRAIGKL